MTDCKRVLITGIQGFVGRYLYRYLVRQKSWEIYGIDKMPDALGMEGNRYFQGDIEKLLEDENIIDTVLPEIIFHLAGAARAESPLSFFQNNFFAGYHLCEKVFSIVQSGVYDPRMIFLGTSAEYGANARVSNTEEDALLPLSHYGVSKALQTYVSLLFTRLNRIRVIIARPTNIIGTGQSRHFVISDFVQKIVQMERGEVEPRLSVKDGSVIRDFIDVRDVVRAIVLLAEHGSSGEVYNIGSNMPVTIRQLAEELCSLARISIRISYEIEKSEPGVICEQASDFSKLQEAAGWKPEIPLSQSIKDIFEEFRSGQAHSL